MVFGRTLYQCENYHEFSKDESEMTENYMNSMDELLKSKFGELIEKSKGTTIERICNAVNSLRQIKYEDIRKKLLNN